MSIALPQTFVDVSTMRDIPDTQECWVDAGCERASVCACMREGTAWQPLGAHVRHARARRDAKMHKLLSSIGRAAVQCHGAVAAASELA